MLGWCSSTNLASLSERTPWKEGEEEDKERRKDTGNECPNMALPMVTRTVITATTTTSMMTTGRYYD